MLLMVKLERVGFEEGWIGRIGCLVLKLKGEIMQLPMAMEAIIERIVYDL